MTYLLTLFAILLAVLRILGYKSQTYQAIAHGFVGGLIAAYLVSRCPVYLCIAMTLTLVELCVFSVQYALGKSS